MSVSSNDSGTDGGGGLLQAAASGDSWLMGGATGQDDVWAAMGAGSGSAESSPDQGSKAGQAAAAAQAAEQARSPPRAAVSEPVQRSPVQKPSPVRRAPAPVVRPAAPVRFQAAPPVRAPETEDDGDLMEQRMTYEQEAEALERLLSSMEESNQRLMRGADDQLARLDRLRDSAMDVMLEVARTHSMANSLFDPSTEDEVKRMQDDIERRATDMVEQC